MNKDIAISNVCKLSVNYKTVGSMSINDWVRKSGWFSYKNSITVDDIRRFLTSNPQLADNWLIYSGNKRTDRGWYFSKNSKDDSFNVGYFESKVGLTKETKYQQSIDACAQFIFNEFQHFNIDSVTE